MSDRIHLTMNRVQSAGVQSQLDRPLAEPDRQQLTLSDNAVLPRRQAG
jgi:hypothetical protein